MHISVVIPAYNEEKYIKGCLESLDKQTVKPYEIILVDNNCTDSTIAIAKEFNVTIIPEKKQGMIFARNTGYDAAKGDIIARTDSDTRLPPDWIEKIAAEFEQNTLDGLTGLVDLYDVPFGPAWGSRFYLFVGRVLAMGRQVMIGPNMALTKAIWLKIRDKVCTDETKIHEDIDVALNIQKAGGIVKQDNSLIAHMSGRRIVRDPASFFIEYPIRSLNTLNMYR